MAQTLPEHGGRHPGNPGSEIDQDLWKQFAEASNPKAFCQSWLSLLCHMLKAGRCAMVLLGASERGPFTPAAIWPNAEVSVKHLAEAAERSLRERRGLLIEADSVPPPENG